MEGVAQSVEDNLIDSLNFKLTPGASYATDRKSVSFFSQGGNFYSPNGVKVIKIMLTGDSWLDPSTCKLFSDVTNTAPTTIDGTVTVESNKLKPAVTGPWGFFRRLRVIVGGQVVEDIDHYGRLHEMFHTTKSTNRRLNDSVEGFDKTDILAPDSTRTVCFSPMSGLLSQKKFLPIRYAPLSLELELVSNGSDAVDTTGVNNKSTDFRLENVQLKCDLVTLDNALDNNYASHLLDGNTLPIHFTSFTCASQIISSLDTSINVSRALTRIKAIYVILYTTDGNRKEINNFYHPMGGAYDSTKELELSLQIGSKKYPEYPIRSAAESFTQFRKTLGINSTTNDHMDITGLEYRDNKFVQSIDTEKILGASFTGINTRGGDLLTISMRPRGNAVLPTTAGTTTKLHYCLQFDQLLEIGDSGSNVLD